MKYFKKTLSVFLVVVFCIVALGTSLLNVSAYDTDYPNTWVNTGNQVDDIIGVALTQVGYHGVEYVTGTKYGAWYGMTYAPWCGMFVSWCAAQANIPSSVVIRSASANSFKNSGVYHYKDNYNPVKGDLCLYNPSGNGGYYWPGKDSSGKYTSSGHVALVVSYDPASGAMVLVHGNSTGDRVCRSTVYKSAASIQAFVTPPYTTGPSSQYQNYSYINASDVRIRQTPGGTIIRNLSYGTYLDVIESTTDGSGDKWYKVKVISTGEVGYVYGEYVYVKEESVPAVPATPPAPTEEPTPTEGKSGYINDSAVRIRNGAGTTSTTVLAVLDYNTKVSVLGSVKDSDGDVWYKVITENSKIEGYVFSKYITLSDDTAQEPEEPAVSNNSDSEKQGYINGSDVRLRSEPSTSGSIITVLGLNTKITVLSEEGSWYKVKLDDGQTVGYVYGEYVTIKEKEPDFRGHFDSPDNGTCYKLSENTVFTAYGWSFTDLGASDIYISIDSATPLLMDKTARDDVKSVFGTACPTAECGFVYSSSLSEIGVGEHTVKVTAKYGDSEWVLDTRTFSIIDDVLPVIVKPLGDVNGDNAVDTKDLTRLKKYLSGITDDISDEADVNGDKVIDTKDLTRLKKYLSGNINSL